MARDLKPLPTPMSETEFGAREGLPRVLAALEREKLPASFYVPAVSAILAPEMLPAIMKSGRHEIALHGASRKRPASARLDIAPAHGR
jgi:peptidoglycan/xylan/chitin deacetylase (PgdA/CDA1 family)